MTCCSTQWEVTCSNMAVQGRTQVGAWGCWSTPKFLAFHKLAKQTKNLSTAMSRWYLVQIHSNNPNNHNHLKHCIAKLQLRVELIHSVVQRQQWQAKSVMEWSLILSGMDSYKCIQMQNILFIKLSMVIWEFQIQLTEAQIMTSYFIGVPPPHPLPLGRKLGAKIKSGNKTDRSRDAHTQSVTKISLHESANTFSPTTFILWLAGVQYPRPHTGCWTRCSEWT